jgi:hypothetical protein
VFEDGQPGEVRRGVCRHPQLAVGEDAIAQGAIEAAGKRVDGVAFGHAAILHDGGPATGY